jgi:hypothetical protein
MISARELMEAEAVQGKPLNAIAYGTLTGHGGGMRDQLLARVAEAAIVALLKEEPRRHTEIIEALDAPQSTTQARLKRLSDKARSSAATTACGARFDARGSLLDRTCEVWIKPISAYHRASE